MVGLRHGYGRAPAGRGCRHAPDPSRPAVADERRSVLFYQAYFGFDPATAQRYGDGTLIIRDADGFDLALHPVASAGPPPGFLHFGFRLAGPGEVRALMARMEGEGVTIVERAEEPACVAFKCPRPRRLPDRGVLGTGRNPLARPPDPNP